MINWILSIHGKNCDITEDVDIGSDHSKLLAKNMHICHIVYDMTLHAYLSLKQRICTGEYMNILALSQGRICSPPPPSLSSEVVRFLWKMRNDASWKVDHWNQYSLNDIFDNFYFDYKAVQFDFKAVFFSLGENTKFWF